MLLLYEDASYDVPGPGEEADRVAEYRDWARRTAAVVDGAELGLGGYLVGAGGASAPIDPASDELGRLSGYFVIRASNLAQVEPWRRAVRMWRIADG